MTLTEERDHDDAGCLLGGFVEVSLNGERSEVFDVSVKLAFTAGERELVEHECEVYQKMREAQVIGISTCCGIYYEREHGDGPKCLVVIDEGEPLCKGRESMSITEAQE